MSKQQEKGLIIDQEVNEPIYMKSENSIPQQIEIFEESQDQINQVVDNGQYLEDNDRLMLVENAKQKYLLRKKRQQRQKKNINSNLKIEEFKDNQILVQPNNINEQINNQKEQNNNQKLDDNIKEINNVYNMENNKYNGEDYNNNNCQIKENKKTRKRKKCLNYYQMERLYQCFHERKHTKLQLTKMFDISGATIQRILTKFIQNGGILLTPQKLFKARKRSIKSQQKQCRIIKIIQQMIQKDPTLYQSQICNKLLLNYNIKISQPTISRIFNKIKLTKKSFTKVYQQANKPKNIQIRYNYCLIYKQLNLSQVLFLDQCGVNKNTKRHQGWSKIGKRICIPISGNPGQTVSILAVMSFQKLQTYCIKKGTFRSTDMVYFIKNKLKRFNNYTIILDNCKIHKTDQVRQAFQNQKINILFLPPYTPQLNPIQMVFHQFKMKLGKYRTISNDVQKGVICALKQLEQRNFQGYERLVYKWVQKGLKKQPFDGLL